MVTPRLIGIVAACAVVFFLGMRYERGSWMERERDWSAIQTAQAEEAARASEQARNREQELLRAREIVETNYRAALAQSAVAARGARTELDRLRDALAERDRSAAEAAAAAGRTDAAAPERELLGACAAEYTDMARDADAVADRLRALQAYEAH